MMPRAIVPAALLLLSATPAAHLAYQRSLSYTGTGPQCAVLDPTIFVHAAPALADLRLLTNTGADLPFVITVSGPAPGDSVTVPIHDLEQHGADLSFKLDLPPRPYTDVTLDLTATDFVAVATVTNSTTHQPLGQFPIFDLSARHLPRSTTLHLAESTIPRIHVELRPAPGTPPLPAASLRGAIIPPSREAQTLFTPAVTASVFSQSGSTTVAHLTLPPHIPIERLRFTLAPGAVPSFARPVRLTATSLPGRSNASPPETESITGVISHLHLKDHGVPLDDTHLAVPAILGANLQSPASVDVTVNNGANPPLPLQSVALESRERRLCFLTAADTGPVTLFYGDPHAPAPSPADAAAIFAGPPARAILGPEQPNPAFTGTTTRRPLARRHPRLFTLGTLIAVCLAAVLALRSGKLRL